MRQYPSRFSLSCGQLARRVRMRVTSVSCSAASRGRNLHHQESEGVKREGPYTAPLLIILYFIIPLLAHRKRLHGELVPLWIMYLFSLLQRWVNQPPRPPPRRCAAAPVVPRPGERQGLLVGGNIVVEVESFVEYGTAIHAGVVDLQRKPSYSSHWKRDGDGSQVTSLVRKALNHVPHARVHLLWIRRLPGPLFFFCSFCSCDHGGH